MEAAHEDLPRWALPRVTSSGNILARPTETTRQQKAAAALIREVGFNPVDLGAFSVRQVEPFVAVVAQIDRDS